jgi:hypothetical protein
MDINATLSAGLALVAATALGWVVLSPRIHEGLIIKSGLITLITGLLAYAGLTLSGIETWSGLGKAAVLQHAGMCVAIAGYALRKASGKRCRRASDWLASRSGREASR